MGSKSLASLIDQTFHGDAEARRRFDQELARELHSLAARHLARERPNHTLQPTEIVNEAYLRMVAQRTPCANREHFLARASEIIRRSLADHARMRKRLKRGGNRKRVSLEEADVATLADHDFGLIDELLRELGRIKPRQEFIVQLVFYGGLTREAVASLIGVSKRTVEGDLALATRWLKERLLAE